MFNALEKSSVRRGSERRAADPIPVSRRPLSSSNVAPQPQRHADAARSVSDAQDNNTSLVVDVTEESGPPSQYVTALRFTSNCRQLFDASHEAMLAALREASSTRAAIDSKIAQLAEMRHGLEREMSDLSLRIRETKTLCDCAAGIGSPTGEVLQLKPSPAAQSQAGIVRGSAKTTTQPFAVPDLRDVLPDSSSKQTTPLRLEYRRTVCGERTSPEPAQPPGPSLRAPTPHQHINYRPVEAAVDRTPRIASHVLRDDDEDAVLLQHLLQAQLRKREEELRRRMIRNSAQRPTNST